MENFKITILPNQIQIGSTIISPEQAIQLAKQLMEAAQQIGPKMFLGEWEEAQNQFNLGLIDYVELQRIKNKENERPA